MSDPIRRRDKYDRPLYADHEVPPISDGATICLWRGRCTTPDPPYAGNTTTVRDLAGRDTCIKGWVASGEWWLHCGICRPYVTEARAMSDPSTNREAILIDCEGSCCPPALAFGFSGICSMCGQEQPVAVGLARPPGVMVPHQRTDIIAMLKRGDFG